MLVPLWSTGPEAVRTYHAQPLAPSPVSFFGVVVPAAVVLAGCSFLLRLHESSPRRLWAGVAAGCMVLHFLVVFFWFVPANQQLGWIETDSAPPDRDQATQAALLFRWRVANGLRIAWEGLGLFAAVKVLSALPRKPHSSP